MPVCFHVIQRSDRKINDHDDEQEKQFAEDCFNELTKKTVQYRLSSKQEKMSKPAFEAADLTSIVRRLKSTNRYFLLTKR